MSNDLTSRGTPASSTPLFLSGGSHRSSTGPGSGRLVVSTLVDLDELDAETMVDFGQALVCRGKHKAEEDAWKARVTWLIEAADPATAAALRALRPDNGADRQRLALTELADAYANEGWNPEDIAEVIAFYAVTELGMGQDAVQAVLGRGTPASSTGSGPTSEREVA